MSWTYNLCRWAMGGIFIYAGSVKLLEPKAFALLLEAYGILPEILLMPVAIVLPVSEVVAGIGLLLDVKGSLSLIAGLLGVFVVILVYGIWMGLDVDCGCFGPNDPEASAFHGLRSTLFRDLVLITGVVFLYGWRRYEAIRPMPVSGLVNRLSQKRSSKDAYL